MRRGLLQLRIAVAILAALFFIAESFNANFLKPQDSSWTPFVQICIGMFGIAWIVQSLFLVKRLRRYGTK